MRVSDQCRRVAPCAPLSSLSSLSSSSNASRRCTCPRSPKEKNEASLLPPSAVASLATAAAQQTDSWSLRLILVCRVHTMDAAPAAAVVSNSSSSSSSSQQQ